MFWWFLCDQFVDILSTVNAAPHNLDESSYDFIPFDKHHGQRNQSTIYHLSVASVSLPQFTSRPKHQLNQFKRVIELNSFLLFSYSLILLTTIYYNFNQSTIHSWSRNVHQKQTQPNCRTEVPSEPNRLLLPNVPALGHSSTFPSILCSFETTHVHHLLSILFSRFLMFFPTLDIHWHINNGHEGKEE